MDAEGTAGTGGADRRPGRVRRRSTKAPDGMGSVRRVREAGVVKKAGVVVTGKSGQPLWRGELWRGRVELDGKAHDVYGASEAEVVRKLEALKAQASTGALLDKSALTVAGLLDQWLADCTVRGLRPRSLAGYTQCARLYLAPAIGKVKVQALKPEHVRTTLADLTRRGIAAATVRKVRVVLHAALQLALRAEIVGRNVADAVKPPRLARAELQPPTPTEAMRFLEAARTARDPLETFFTLALYTGCRPGELLALRWPDVDWEAGRIRIRRNLTRVAKGAPTMAEPKTARGRRVLTLPPAPIAALRAHRKRQAEDRLKLGSDYAAHDLVFCTRTGAPLLARNVVRSFKRVLALAGLRTAIRLYDLRHANATAMLAAGIHPKVASERLGHAGVTLFMDTYSHLLPELEAGAASALQDVFGRAGQAASTGTG